MTTKLYSALLLTVSISLAGCQSIEIIPPKTTPYAEKIVVATPSIKDSDGDGVLDDFDQCPGTLINIEVDESGCPTQEYIIEEYINEFRAFYLENSSEPTNFDYTEINRLAELMQEYDKAIMLVEGHISKIENQYGYETLARNRAEFVKNYVVSNHSIDPVRIVICPYSDDMPIATNDSLEGRAMNQRVYAHFRGGYINLPNNCQ